MSDCSLSVFFNFICFFKLFMFDLEIKKYIYEEIKNHYTIFNEKTKDALTTLILYLETLEIYKE